ncbi:carbohydrate sulfotransferase 10 [Procambarus clarkii]|uniref:carbohydrate sulfotransferase 10 n=1 Tax=Procambarus clarkii TaxID=6728 RepID=UPI003743116F
MMGTATDAVKCFGKGRKRVCRLLLVLVVLTLCAVAHVMLFRIQPNHYTPSVQFGTTPSHPTTPTAHEDNLCDGFCANTLMNNFTQYNTDSNKAFVKTSSSSEVVVKQVVLGDVAEMTPRREDLVLPTRPRARNQKLYKKDVVKSLSGTWTEEMREARQKVLRERRLRVQEVCHTTNVTGVAKLYPVYTNLRWVPQHHFVWCPIFKAASTTWVKYLLMLAGKVENESLHGQVKQLFPPPGSARDRERLLADSMRLIIVRHPFERLLSAYRDKMLRVKGSNDPYLKLQHKIAHRYEDSSRTASSNIKAESLGLANTTTTNHPTFTQFLSHVRTDQIKFRKKGWWPVNLHWRPYWVTCSPCQLDYNVIAQVETLGDDHEYIIRELGLQHLLLNAHTHASKFDMYNGTSEAAQFYFRQVPLNLLRALADLYEPDFQLFGYSPLEYFHMAKRS